MKEPVGQLFERIKTYLDLPSLPYVLLKLIRACKGEDSSIEDLADIINIGVKFLSVINKFGDILT